MKIVEISLLKYRKPQSINWKYNFKPLMNSGGLCMKMDKTRKIGGRYPFIMGLSSGVNGSYLNQQTEMVNEHNRNIPLNGPVVAETLSTIYDKYIVVPTDNAPYSVTLMLKDKIRLG